MYIWSWLRSITEAYNKPYITSTKVGVVIGMIDNTTGLMNVCRENVQGLDISKTNLSYLWLKYPNVPRHPLAREQLVHGGAQPRLWGQLGVGVWAQHWQCDSNLHIFTEWCSGEKALRENTSAESVTAKCAMARKFTWEVQPGDTFRPPSSLQRKEVKMLKNIEGSQANKWDQQYMMSIFCLCFCLLFFLTEKSMVAIETSYGIKSVHPGWGSILFSV